MGFWQHLVESYEKNAASLKKNYPLSSTTISNNSDQIVVVTIDEKGNFLDCDAFPKRPTGKTRNEVPLVNIPIPVTEKSLGRSSSGAWKNPNPVFDQFGYLKGSGKKFDAYIEQLKKFAESEFSSVQVKAIYEYAKKRTISHDILKLQPKEKTNIIFEVQVVCNPQSKVWEDELFYDSWNRYYMSAKKQLLNDKIYAASKLLTDDLPRGEKKLLQDLVDLKESESIDYLTGEPFSLGAISHPKKLCNGAANSKLISDNDGTNYTYRGKFTDSSQAVFVGYDSSQKAHQYLRYLVRDRGYSCGEQVILSYTIGSTKNEVPPPVDEGSILGMVSSSLKTEGDLKIELSADTGFDYATALRKSLAGFGTNTALIEHEQTAVIALDAATSGRLSVTFYRELSRSDYLETIAKWHETCKWNHVFKDKELNQYISFTGAPSVDRIIEAIYGKPRGSKDEQYIKIKKATRERLIRCIFDGSDLPIDYVRSALQRASNPLAITRNGKFNRHDFKTVISTACALTRKYNQQRHNEVYEMNIELERTDRDYLYGRLLGAADKLEEYALYKKANDRTVTSAIRYMQAFSQHPFRTWKTIHDCLNPYIQQVKSSFAFNEIKMIMQLFKGIDYENDKPLGGSYLIGYYHEITHIENMINKASINKEQEQE